MSLLSDDDCTRLYNEANGITTKNPPLSTERIFKAMRQAHAQGFAAGAASQLSSEPVAARVWVGSYEGADHENQYVYSEDGDGEPLYTRREA